MVLLDQEILIKNVREIEYNKKLNFSTFEFKYLMLYSGLTDREKEIFKLKQKGYSNIEIAVELHLSAPTVSRAVSSIRRKIQKCITNFYKYNAD